MEGVAINTADGVAEYVATEVRAMDHEEDPRRNSISPLGCFCGTTAPFTRQLLLKQRRRLEPKRALSEV